MLRVITKIQDVKIIEVGGGFFPTKNDHLVGQQRVGVPDININKQLGQIIVQINGLKSSLACTKALSSDPRDARDRRHGNNLSLQCNVLVFGGSDCSGTFYNDTIKCTVELRV